MAKRTNEQQRLVNFAYAAEEGELTAAINTLVALRDARFPKTPKKAAAPRKPRADKGSKRGLPDASKPNGGDEVGGEQ